MIVTPQEIYQNTFKTYPDLLNVVQVSEILSVSTKTVYRLLRQESIASLRVGRELRIPKIHLMHYLRVFDPTSQEQATA